MTTDKKSPFKFVGFLIEESSILRKPIDEKGEFAFEIDPKGVHYSTEKTFQLNLSVHVYEGNGRFDAKIRAVGLFDFKDVFTLDDLSTYFFTSAPAMLFPYIRAYIASLTALSGMEAIHLPLVNLGTYKQKLIENTIEVSESVESKDIPPKTP